MLTIVLSEPWTYRTPVITIDFPAGEQQVSEEIAAAATSAGVHSPPQDIEQDES